MAIRFKGLRARMISQKRTTFWLSATAITDTLSTASTAAILTTLNAAALALRPFTIVRTRGYWHIHSDQGAATEVQEAAYGRIIVSDQSVAIGVTAIPTPVTDSQSSWYMYERMVAHLDFSSAVGFDADAGHQREVDSKAMRKVEEGQDVISVWETGPNSDGVAGTFFTRTLIKLH